MIIGLGSDIVEHSANAKLLEFDELGRFPKRILSDAEHTIYLQTKNSTYIAGRFAAKEAILKALGTGMHDEISLKDIYISTSASGQPEVSLTGYVKSLADQMKVNKWHLTISHSESYSIAFAIAEAL